jgi:hypothetical protein
MDKPKEDVGYLRKVALLEVNFLLFEQLLPPEFEGMKVELKGEKEIVDMQGEVIFHQIHLSDSRGQSSGFIEFAVDPIFGGVLLSVGLGNGTYRADALMSMGAGVGEWRMASEVSADEQLVLYSYPKLGVRTKSGELRDISSGDVVGENDGSAAGGLDVGRAQYLRDDLSANEIKRRDDRFCVEREFWRAVIDGAPVNTSWGTISRRWFQGIIGGKISINAKSMYKVINSSDSPDQGIQLFSQDLLPWCFGACVQALLSFYRYSYSQAVLAYVLGLGNRVAPNALPRSTEHDVIVTIEKMARGVLKGTMVRSPEWLDFSNEVDAGRPVIGLIEDHCRLVIGSSTIGAVAGIEPNSRNLSLRGLTLLDPWPARRGTVVCWENFDAITYAGMFGARLNLLGDEEIGIIDHILKEAGEYIKNNSSAWNLNEEARVAGIETLDPHGQRSGWLARVEEDSKVVGFVRFGKDLTFGEFYKSQHGGPFLDRSLAEAKISQLSEKGERIGKARLTLDQSDAVVWAAMAKKPNSDMREIRLEDFKIPTESIP